MTCRRSTRSHPLSALLMLALIGCLGAESKDVRFEDAKPDPKAAAPEIVIDFEKLEVGQTPQGFTSALSGGGGPVAWSLQEDGSSPAGPKVLAQTSADRTNKRFPVIVHDDFSGKDVAVTVQFKTISGEVDQAAGIVWRFKDKDNYYVVRANALENNVVMYKVEGGTRTDLKIAGGGSDYGVKASVLGGQWNKLRVRAVGDTFTVYLNDKALFECVDKTFRDAGKVGLWTKADSVTRFDDLRIQPFDAK
jgi:hypothetical protein